MGFFEKLKQGLAKTRSGFSEKISGVLSAFTRVDEDLLEELEEALILCDMGVETSLAAIEALRQRVKEERIRQPEQVREEMFIRDRCKSQSRALSKSFSARWGRMRAAGAFR